MREWPKTWNGEEPTGSVLESGSQAAFSERPQGELVIVDVASGGCQKVMCGFFRDLRLSPDKRHIAFSRQMDIFRPPTVQRLPRVYHERRQLGIVTADGEVEADGVQELDQAFTAPLRWSPDSAELGVIGREAGSAESPSRVFRYRLADGHLEPATPPDLEPVSFSWTGKHGLLVLAGPARGADQHEKTPERHWWHVQDVDRPRNLTADMESVPRTLIPETGLSSFVGLADGNVFRLSVEDGQHTNLTAGSERKISSIAWPFGNLADGQAYERLVLAVEHDSTRWHFLDLESGELSTASKPTGNATILHFAPEHGTALLACSDRTGNRLWLSRPAFERQTVICEKNGWLAGLAEGEVRPVEYLSLDGDELKGWLLLPVGYREGTRYPLITSVYPGTVFARDMPSTSMFSINGHHCLNLQLLAAQGFAVLVPSMPLEPEGEPSDPYLALSKGVLPAVDKAIGLGVADPARLGLMGQSYGGYATYGLITQTRRFKAAVALAGLSELISLYGQFDARMRYDDYPHENLFSATLAEAGQDRMGSPPWKDAARYLRNSPLFYADRVETPLLIIQGDMDYVPLQQGEQFFAALYRQSKRARFVRYWGEGHVLASPANIRDMWQRIFGWFDEHLNRSPGSNQDPPVPPVPPVILPPR